MQGGMTTIRATCERCGDVELLPHEVKLVVCNIRSFSYYGFHCAGCDTEVRRPATGDIIALLSKGGVTFEEWHIPLETQDPQRLSDRPFTFDDVIDFHEGLEMFSAAVVVEMAERGL